MMVSVANRLRLVSSYSSAPAKAAHSPEAARPRRGSRPPGPSLEVHVNGRAPLRALQRLLTEVARQREPLASPRTCGSAPIVSSTSRWLCLSVSSRASLARAERAPCRLQWSSQAVRPGARDTNSSGRADRCARTGAASSPACWRAARSCPREELHVRLDDRDRRLEVCAATAMNCRRVSSNRSLSVMSA